MADPALRPAPPPRVPAGKANRRRLLLVDDELSIARFLAHGAEECGYEAIITVTSDSFRSQYRTLVPDVVVMDLALPGTDGVELLRFLAEENSRARILLVSGFDGRVLEAAMRLGAAMGLDMAPPLQKPVRLDQLMTAIVPKEPAHDPCFG